MDIEHFIEDMNIKYNAVIFKCMNKKSIPLIKRRQELFINFPGFWAAQWKIFWKIRKCNRTASLREPFSREAVLYLHKNPAIMFQFFKPLVSVQFVTFKLPSEANIDRLSPGRL